MNPPIERTPADVQPPASEHSNGQAPPQEAEVVQPAIPTAIVRPVPPKRMTSRLWWLTGLSAVIAIVLFVSSVRHHGPRITIHFEQGYGLKAGDLLRHRGISVGEVTDVVLDPKLNGVICTVVLDPQAESLARRGSEFWIERPRVSLTRVSGLETVVGAKHLGVRAGPADGPRVFQFDGLESPPTLIDADSAEITIRFTEGYGLQAGDPVRFRGMTIGEVASVELDPQLSSVAVKVRLIDSARHIAREGSQFWVERPRVGITEVRGLETLVSGRYVAVLPGDSDQEPCESFNGLDAPPPIEFPPGSIEILLHAPQRWGVERGVPVTYRGLRVGQVHSVGLSSDGTRVEARASIESKYRSLVRRNSVFWSTSGVDVGFGLTGLQLNTETLTTIAQGGISFATPDTPGEPVSSGQRFAYERRAPNDAANWNPHIDVHQGSRENSSARPQPQRAIVRWAEKSFGFRRNQERTGWVTFVDDQTLLAPTDLFIPAAHPLDAVVMEVAGLQITLDASRVQQQGAVARYPLDKGESAPDGVSAWPSKRIRNVAEPVDLLIIGDSQAAPHPLTASTLKQKDGVWVLPSASGLNANWHGAIAVAASDGNIIAVVCIERGSPQLVPIHE